jgi:hypothetical protein
MAVRNYAVANPSKTTDVTTNGKTAKANGVTVLAFDDAALANGWTDLVVFLAAGCAVLSADPAQYVESTAQEAAYLLYAEQEYIEYPTTAR